MTKYYLLLILFLFYIDLLSQDNSQESEKVRSDVLIDLIKKNKRKTIDSLYVWGVELLNISEKQNNDTIRYEALKTNSYYFLRNREFDSVKKYDDLMLEIAKRLDSFKVISSYQNKAAYYNEKSVKDSALYILKKAQGIGYNNLRSQTKEDSIQKINKILFIETAIVKNYFRNKAFDKALELTYANLNTSNKYGITRFHAWNYFYLGLLNLELEKFEEAEIYYRKELEYSRKSKKKNMEGFALMHIGNVFYRKNEIRQAKYYYLEAKTLFEQIDYLKGKLLSKKKIVAIYEEENDFVKASILGEEYLKEYLERSNMDIYSSSFCVKLGRIFHKKGDKFKGDSLINIGLNYAKENFEEKNVDIYNEAYTTYKELRRYKEALTNYEILTKLKDSLLLNDTFTQQLADANIKFEVEKKNNKILNQELKAEKEERKKQKLISVICIVILLLFLLVYFLAKRGKELKAEKDKHIQELERGKRLRNMVSHLRNTPNKIDGINDTKFHKFLKQKLQIDNDLLKVYLPLVEGKTYKEIADIITLSLSGTKSRINKLYDALKIYSKDFDIKMSNSKSVKIFNDLYVDFQVNR